MPKLMLWTLATSGLLTAAALSAFASGRRYAGGLADTLRGKAALPWQPRLQNRAFAEYRAGVIAKLEEEQREFAAYLERLRHSQDRAEFESFRTEHRKTTSE